MKRKFLFIIAGFIVIATGIGSYLYMKPVKNLEKARADFQVEAAAFVEEFSGNESQASEKYVNRVVEITGPLVNIHTSERGITTLFLLDDLFGISCSMDSAYSASVKTELELINIGDNLTIRGRCNGILTDVQLSGCILVKE